MVGGGRLVLGRAHSGLDRPWPFLYTLANSINKGFEGEE